MKKETDQLEALQDIRKMMKESSRFLSLSGLSGVLAGIYALTGAYLGNRVIESSHDFTNAGNIPFTTVLGQITLISLGVLVASVVTALYFSYKKAHKNNHQLFDHSSKKLFWSMSLPLFAGGVFCVALLLDGNSHLLYICPVMLIFYGLALTSSSRFTLDDLKYLGYMEVALGLTALFFPAYGLIFWALGFGVLHIIYGSIMHFKYDRH